MPRNPLLEKFQKNEVALGLGINNPDMVELCAFLGFDWFQLDQMWSELDWGKTKEMIRTGQAAEITPVLRVQSNPWLGYDHRIAVDATRAQGIGAQFILVSNSCNKEIEECLGATRSWHRNIRAVHPFRSIGEWDAKSSQMTEATYIIPQPESKGGLEEMEQTLELPGLKAFFIAMTDASKAISGTKTPEFNHPKLWEYVHKAVRIGEKKGIVIGANTSYAYTMEEMENRTKQLADAGVKMIMIQGAPFLFQVAIGKFLDNVKKSLHLN
jgi:4-hydroxy-2-oxoheptanedioate aldolase